MEPDKPIEPTPPPVDTVEEPNSQPESIAPNIPEQEPTSTPPVSQEVGPVTPAKKSATKPLIIVGVIIVVIALLVAAWLVLYPPKKAVAPQPSAADNTSRTTDNPAVNDATSAMTNGSKDEANLTSTDDSSDADAATKSATNVGDSIDENNL